ncbi:carboxypeptidase-like regulatory domain-containing protein [Gimesia aquarii]|uniref:Carboxypeptidase regulatory-like domain-containing protein n=1 Tax=Gimesia aquarii TaxID=2527964 RepID=A0A517VUN9_9PLAN|nr:carboxypeptidase-like regulatory domain-containing protein [Gimesia aquarii]QDT96721.1 hypothetical protein V144x_21790 [Gimesia aquarii]
MSRAKCLVLFFLSFLLLQVGCGDRGDRPELAHVSGTITLDGNPVECARVMFMPTEGGAPRGAIGVSNPDGKYELIYINEKGCPPGKFKVAITTRGQKYDDEGNFVGAREESIPAKYHNENKTKLTANISLDDENVVDFSLKSE